MNFVLTTAFINFTSLLYPEIYESVVSSSEPVKKSLTNLRAVIDKELNYHQSLEEIQGMLDVLLIASNADLDSNPDLKIPETTDIFKNQTAGTSNSMEVTEKRWRCFRYWPWGIGHYGHVVGQPIKGFNTTSPDHASPTSMLLFTLPYIYKAV